MKSKRTVIDVNDFSGGLLTNIPVTGMDTKFTPDCLNVYGEGTKLRKRKGISKLNTSTVAAGSVGNGVFNWVKSASDQLLMAVFGGKLHKMDIAGTAWDGTFDAVSSHATSGTPWSSSITHFATYAGTLLFTNEDRGHPQKMLTTDASHFDIESGGAGVAPNGKYIQVWKEHVWIMNILTGGALEEDMLTISDWLDADVGGGASTQATTDGLSTMKLVGLTGASASHAIRTRDIGDLDDDYILEIKNNFGLVESVSGTSTSTGHCIYQFGNGAIDLSTRWSEDGLELYDGAAWNEVGVSQVVESVWNTWKFIVTGGTATGATVDVLKDGTYIGVGLDASNAASLNDGSINLTAQAGTGTGATAYIDYIKINSSSPEVEYFTDGDFGDWDSTVIPTTPNLVAEPVQPLVHLKLNDDTTSEDLINNGVENTTANTYVGATTIDTDQVSVTGKVSKAMDFDNPVSELALVHYKLNDNTTSEDIVGSGVEATTANMYASTTTLDTDQVNGTGQISGSISFTSASSHHIRLATATMSSMSDDANGTFAFWVKPNATDTHPIFSGYDEPGGGNGILVRILGSNFPGVAVTKGSANTLEFRASSAVTTGAWNHIAITQNGTAPVMYVNGSLSTVVYTDSTDKTTWFSASGTAIDTGRIGDDGFGKFIDGDLDDFRYYSKALTAAEIESIYNSGTGTEADLAEHHGRLASATVTSMSDDNVGTIALWAKPDVIGSSATLFSLGDTNDDKIVNVRMMGTGNLRFTLDETGVLLDVQADSASLSAGSQTHIAIVSDAATTKFYVNAATVATTVITGTDGKWFNDMTGLDNGRLGCNNANNAGNTNFYQGEIDDFRYYSSALTAQQISAIYADGNGTESQAITNQEGTTPTAKIGTFSYEFTNDTASDVVAVTQTLATSSALAGIASVTGAWFFGTNLATYKIRLDDGTTNHDSAVFTANGTWQYQTFEFTPNSATTSLLWKLVSTSAATIRIDQASIRKKSQGGVDNTNADRVQRSAVGTLNDWSGTDSGTNDIVTAEDVGVTGSFILSDKMYVTKKHSIHRFTYTASTPLVIIKQIRTGIGTSSPRSTKNISIGGTSEAVIFLGTDRRLYQFDGFDTVQIGSNIDLNNGITSVYLQNINTQALDKVFAVLHDDNPWYELFVPLGNSTVPDFSIVYDYISKSFWPMGNRNFRAGVQSDNGAGQTVTYALGNTTG